MAGSPEAIRASGGAIELKKSDSPGGGGGDHARFFLSGLVASGVKPPEVLSHII